MVRRRGLVASWLLWTSCGRVGFDLADATSSDTRTDAPPCVPGGIAFAVAAFDPSPIAGEACAHQNALDEDGLVAGLDRFDNAIGMIGGQGVSGCVGVDFGAVVAIDPIVVRVAPSHDACGRACDTNLCDTGNTFAMFAGAVAGDYPFFDGRDLLSTALTDVSYTVGAPVRYVVVCRGGWGQGRDDVAVDVIRGTCP